MSTDHNPSHAGQPIEPEGPRTQADLDDLRREVDDTERRLAAQIEPGPRLIAVAACIIVVGGALFLPHTGKVTGLQILTGHGPGSMLSIVITSKVFVWMSLLFGVIASGAAVLTRRWVVALLAAAGSAVGSVFGLLSVWSRQTPGLHGEPPSGAGVGLILGWIALIVLTVLWVRLVWVRTAFQKAVEAERRETAREFGDDAFRRFTDPDHTRPRG
ncbi:Rv2732c family membrane protein [Tsukamurella soli]|uniref:Transmembrane protein n=1 Tax=Tsukamurella soli TaxID=644556 RepID=A0ABP8JM62_9ACTN